MNISSIGVQTNPPRFSAYVASKAALDAWSNVVSSEVVGHGITFTNVHMPLVRTPMIAPTKIYDKFPTISPAQAADVVIKAMVDKPHEINTALGTAGETGPHDRPAHRLPGAQPRLPGLPGLGGREGPEAHLAGSSRRRGGPRREPPGDRADAARPASSAACTGEALGALPRLARLDRATRVGDPLAPACPGTARRAPRRSPARARRGPRSPRSRSRPRRRHRAPPRPRRRPRPGSAGARKRPSAPRLHVVGTFRAPGT
ncbi:SDR family NAD(P)-dependent oxidoreductase [Nocardioides convexus]|uniref:SDR family NAD(P)-dependent oxidoreductase n=1 Tax=Nocardioides convexus TaxID=2712224 RepID=UPI0024181E8D|nr:SDR family NAD(P)-dependent oxidoreductase [Nocardioides convexus]